MRCHTWGCWGTSISASAGGLRVITPVKRERSPVNVGGTPVRTRSTREEVILRAHGMYLFACACIPYTHRGQACLHSPHAPAHGISRAVRRRKPRADCPLFVSSDHQRRCCELLLVRGAPVRESSSARGMYLIAHACIPYKHGTKCVCTPPTLLPMPYLEKYDFGNLGPTAPCSYNRITREDAVVSCCWSDRPRRSPSRPPPPIATKTIFTAKLQNVYTVYDPFLFFTSTPGTTII